eukprot:COSAG02_NODE_6834_length_3337_cov_28.082149_2_plen_114_part_00
MEERGEESRTRCDTEAKLSLRVTTGGGGGVVGWEGWRKGWATPAATRLRFFCHVGWVWVTSLRSASSMTMSSTTLRRRKRGRNRRERSASGSDGHRSSSHRSSHHSSNGPTLS